MESCLKYGDLVIFHHNSKQNKLDTRIGKMSSFEYKNEVGFLSATGYGA